VVELTRDPEARDRGIGDERQAFARAVVDYREDAEAIYGREDIELPRNLMAGWMGRVGFHLEPLADRVLHHIRMGERIFADETTLPTLAPGTGKAKIAWLWTYARDDQSFGGTGPPMVAYRFEDSRGGKSRASPCRIRGTVAERRLWRLHTARRCPSRRRPSVARGLLGASQAVLL
jgi:hypothetical protein